MSYSYLATGNSFNLAISLWLSYCDIIGSGFDLNGLSCLDTPTTTNLTKWYSVNVTGIEGLTPEVGSCHQ
jgi:hypothetical protein